MVNITNDSLKAGKLRVVVEVPWSNLDRQLGAALKAEKRSRKKRNSSSAKE
jgi:hypothetical protein